MRLTGSATLYVHISLLSLCGLAGAAGAAVPLTVDQQLARTPAPVVKLVQQTFPNIDAVSTGARAAAGAKIYSVIGSKTPTGGEDLRRVTLDSTGQATITKNLLPKVKAAVRAYAGPRIRLGLEAGGFARAGNPLFLVRPDQVNEQQVVYSWKTGKVSDTTKP